MKTLSLITFLSTLVIASCDLSPVEEGDTIINFPEEPNRWSIPYPPELLKAVVVDSVDVEMVWRDNSDNEDGFEVHMVGSEGYNSAVFKVPENVDSILVGQWTSNSFFTRTGTRYWVRAFNRGGESPSSNSIVIEY